MSETVIIQYLTGRDQKFERVDLVTIGEKFLNIAINRKETGLAGALLAPEGYFDRIIHIRIDQIGLIDRIEEVKK